VAPGLTLCLRDVVVSGKFLVLSIAQPALSKEIRLVEDLLGVDLRIRSSSGAALTPAGSVLLVHSRYALDAVVGMATPICTEKLFHSLDYGQDR
jgi:Bacterial regulatory helix-turn-helix protein, lysR family